MYELSFRIKHVGCPIADISEIHKGTMVQWCNDETDVYEIKSEDTETLQRIVDEFRKLGRKLGRMNVRVMNLDEESSTLILQSLSGCMCGPAFKLRNVASVIQTVRKNRCVQIPPTIYKAGWEYYTVLSFHPSDYKNLFVALGKLGRIEVLSKKSSSGVVQGSFTISLRGLFSQITPKQLDAYIGALDGGYYAVPRKTTIGKIARRRRVARTTYDEHLRKAESKVALAIAPYLRIYEAGSHT